ncbi:hypothetical protein BD560DRAFT_491035 [Blakeslea trispora]|nr:hypothetical protein BD560DRAFT_491035 [Blakeslea trispora]
MVYLTYLALSAFTAILNVQASIVSEYNSDYYSEHVSQHVNQYYSDSGASSIITDDSSYYAQNNFPCRIMPTCYPRNTAFFQDPCRAEYGNGWTNVATIACLANPINEQYVCCNRQ